MADVAISALTAVTAALLAQEVPVNDAGTTKKLTLTQLRDLFVVSDTDTVGTPTTSATAVDTNIALVLPIGTYQLIGSGTYIGASGTVGPRWTCVSDGTLVASQFALAVSILTAATTVHVASTIALGTLTPHTNSSTSTRQFFMQGHIVVTTAGTLKLQFATETGGTSNTMSTCYFSALRIV